MSSCQTAVAEALEAFGRIDVLFCCCSEGALEPLLVRLILVSTLDR